MPLIPPPASAITFENKTLTGNTAIADAFFLPGDVSPSQITSNQNNYNPASLASASILRLSSDASRDITGLSSGTDGRQITLINIGSFNIVLKHESGSSTAANRFSFVDSVDRTLAPGLALTIRYDSNTSRWAAFVPIAKANGTIVKTGTDDERFATIKALTDAFVEVSVADTANIVLDFANGYNFTVTLGGNRMLGNPTNVRAGQPGGRIRVVQDGGGNRTLTFDTNWKREGGAPSLTTTGGAQDFIRYDVVNSTFIEYKLSKNPSS
jgi:hypothetical protein